MKVCQFGPGCFGCCGDDFKEKKEIIKDIQENIIHFGMCNDKEAFMRRPPYYKPSGICGNIGFVNGKIGCLVYPKKQDKDMRKGYCDDCFECKTLKEFKLWNEERQKAFLRFLEKKELDFYDFSINMENGKLLEEFNGSDSWRRH